MWGAGEVRGQVPRPTPERRFFVGAEGLEDATRQHGTPRNVVKRREPMPAPDAVGSGSQMHPDAAVRAAIDAALDARLYMRARALLDVLIADAE